MSDEAVRLFDRFLDALYPAALGERPWGAALTLLLQLGRARGDHCRELFQSALAHVPRALSISRQLSAETRGLAALESAGNALPCGLLLMDANSRVLFASSRAQALLRGRPGVLLEGSRLRALRGSGESMLGRTLAAVIADAEAGPLCVSLPAQAGRPGLRLLLMRAPATAPAVPADSILVLAFEQNPRGPVPGPALLRDVYGLSPAEAQLAGLLLSGQTLLEASRTRRVSLNTARSQLKGVLRKTGCRNQADLIRTLVAGPTGLLQGLIPLQAGESRPRQT